MEEILLILAGFKSDIFFFTRNQGEIIGYELDETSTKFSAPEKEQLRKILEIAHIYKRLSIFCEKYRFFSGESAISNNEFFEEDDHTDLANDSLDFHPTMEIDENLEKSKQTTTSKSDIQKTFFYIRTICVAIDQILESYLGFLSELELQVQKNPLLRLSFLLHQLSPFFVVFRELFHFIGEIVKEDGRKKTMDLGLRGGALLDYVHSKTYDGDPLVRATMQR